MLTQRAFRRIVSRFPWPNGARPTLARLVYESSRGGKSPYYTVALSNASMRLILRESTAEEAVRQAFANWLTSAGLSPSGARALAAPLHDELARNAN